MPIASPHTLLYFTIPQTSQNPATRHSANTQTNTGQNITLTNLREGLA